MYDLKLPKEGSFQTGTGLHDTLDFPHPRMTTPTPINMLSCEHAHFSEQAVKSSSQQVFCDVSCIGRISYSDYNICSQSTMATFEVIRSGCASALKIQLQGQAAVFAENDALVSKTQNVEIGASLGNSGGLLGGLLGGAARSFLTNESRSCDFY